MRERRAHPHLNPPPPGADKGGNSLFPRVREDKMVGLGGVETIRVTKTGVVDIAEFYLGYVAGELPMVEMLEIPGLFSDQGAMRKACQAWRPHLTKLIDEKVNG